MIASLPVSESRRQRCLVHRQGGDLTNRRARLLTGRALRASRSPHTVHSIARAAPLRLTTRPRQFARVPLQPSGTSAQ